MISSSLPSTASSACAAVIDIRPPISSSPALKRLSLSSRNAVARNGLPATHQSDLGTTCWPSTRRPTVPLSIAPHSAEQSCRSIPFFFPVSSRHTCGHKVTLMCVCRASMVHCQSRSRHCLSHCLCTKRESVQMSWHLWPPHPALLDWQGVSTRPRMDSRPEL